MNATTATASAAATEETPAEEAAATPLSGPLVLSADGEQALRDRAGRLREHLLRTGEAPAPDAPGAHRAVVLAADRDEAVRALDALIEGAPAAGTVTGRAGTGRLAYLFTGQGAQRPGMGAELHRAFPAYADAFDEVCAALDAHLPHPLREIVDDPDPARLARTEYTQPATFAVEVALFRLLESFGLRPDVLAGHSIGEIAAAHAAGVLTLDDAARLVAGRGRLMQALPEGGVMVAVLASEADVLPLLEGRTATVGVAAVNGPNSVVLAGERAAVEEIAALLKAEGRKTRALPVSHAFHSPLMEDVLAPFHALIEDTAFGEPEIPLVSTLTGLPAGDDIRTPGYWVRHVRGAVRFADAVRTLEDQGVTTFVEIGPDAPLTGLAKSCLTAPEDAALVPTLRRARPEVRTLTAALAQAHVRGADVDWQAFRDGGAGLARS
ncbi:acyltransferase domain-containing protein [Streptomyces sp. HU2014]|uniref:acyltransferase domain-containing protein n=1 Tax=Streptomyces sp. HU2014 TaxID=2939414 RepID=UPI00200C2F10|nr:acyltransferase domain-containing protein [Streptomyces sp. HU2014]UQI45065.1 acyltransferase domain-containing protein [Streptomyces sp. HU2014]